MKISSFYSKSADNNQLLQQRRTILKTGLLSVVAGIVPLAWAGNANASSVKNTPWKLSFRNAHTGESFSGVYRVGNQYLPQAFERINYVLRDFRTDEVFPMDPHVMDILAVVHKKMRTNQPYEVLSGYRSPKTNAMLGRNSGGVATNSFHMYGQAIDMRIPGKKINDVRSAAISVKAGGVGFYPRSSFVHIDTGTVRNWTS